MVRFPMRRWYRLGKVRLARAPVFVHWSVPLIVVLCAVASFKAPVRIAVLLTSILLLFLIHELGHTLVCRRLGVEVLAIRISLGHGQCVHEVPYSRWEEALIAWGGVAAQAIVAIPLIMLDVLWPTHKGLLGPPIMILGYYSLFMIAFNLLPVAGLDGSK